MPGFRRHQAAAAIDTRQFQQFGEIELFHLRAGRAQFVQRDIESLLHLRLHVRTDVVKGKAEAQAFQGWRSIGNIVAGQGRIQDGAAIDTVCDGAGRVEGAR